MAGIVLSRRAVWLGLVLATSGLAVAAYMAIQALDTASLKTRLIAEVQRATGRTLTISGGMGIKLALAPTVTIDDVTLSNPPGFSQPDMIRAARVEVSLGLARLFERRIEIERVSLVRPEIMLETDRAGHANWVFAREAQTTTGAAPAGGTAAGNGFTVSFRDANVTDGRVVWLDGVSGRRVEATIGQLDVSGSESGKARITGTLGYDGRTIQLTGRTGPEETTIPPSGLGIWPVALKLESGGASLSVAGQFTGNRDLRYQTFILNGNLPDPSSFASLVPDARLAALKAVTARAEITVDGGLIPAVSALEVRAGSVDLDAVAHGARLEDVVLTTRGELPIEVAARLVAPGLNSTISGTAGDFAWLRRGATGPLAVDLAWIAGSARATVKGLIQVPSQFGGFALDVTADVPDPALVMASAPPAVKSVVFAGRLTDVPGPVPFQLTSSAGDLSGEVSVSLHPRLLVEGRASSRRLDLDALLRRPPPALAVPGVAPGAAPDVRVPSAAPGAAADPPAPDKAVRDKTAPDRTARVIPDMRLPFDLIRTADAGINLVLADVRLGGGDLHGVDAVLTVKDGVLRLDKFTVAAPDQRLSVLLVADGKQSPPRVRLAVESPGLALRPLLAMLNMVPVATGVMEVHADLTAAGETTRALAASLDGRAGLAIAGGQLDARIVNAWLEQLRPLRVEGGNVTDLRCFAVRADAKAGVVTIQPLAFNTAALIVDGGGEVDLGQETLSLRLRPRATISGTGIALPLRISGHLVAPVTRVDISPGGLGGGGLAGLLIGGKDIMGAAGGGDPCPAALARAREGVMPPGAEPSPEGPK